MCRIAGIISPSKLPDELRTQVQSMCDIMQHGGPDDEGIFLEPNFNLCLGHRRLSLIDLSSSGHQPMSDTSNRCHIVFNGEIYNFQELKTDLLSKGHRFKSSTDTEVILAAYIEWGTESFKLFNGMFAFALYDKAKNQCFLVRDSVGMKPLYYSTRSSGELFFSSEVKAFKKITHHWPENPDWPLMLLCFGHIPEPYTTLHKVFCLQKGHFLQYDLDKKGITGIFPFKKFKFTGKITNKEEAVFQIREKLRNSVKRHLISDAPIGIFLSGGIDSSLLALLAENKLKNQLHTLSVNFNEKEYSEKEYQDTVIHKINSEHTTCNIKKGDFEEHLEEIIAAYDQPSDDGINSWFISQCAHSAGLKAVLSGVGGDEVFGGYPSFKRMDKIYSINTLPAGFLKYSRFLSHTPFKRLSWLQIDGPVGMYLTIRGLCTPEEAAALSGQSIDEVIRRIENLELMPQFENPLPKDEAASWLEFNMYMQNQLLKDSDYMSMQHGLELRLPFLDQEFLDTSFSIDTELLYKHQGLPKQLLIDAFKDILPEKIWNRKKMGFSFPLQKWFGSMEQIRQGVARTKEGETLLANFDQHKAHWSKVWAYYLATHFKFAN